MAVSVASIERIPGSGWRLGETLVKGLSRSSSAGAPYMGEYAASRILSAILRLRGVCWEGPPNMGGSPVSPRRLSIGLSDFFRSLSLPGVAMAALLLISSCSLASTPTTVVVSSSAPVSSTTTTASTVPTASTSIASGTTSTTLPAAQDVIRAWSAFWGAWVTVRASDDLDPGPLEPVAAPDVVAGVIALFERQRSAGSGPVQTEIALHPKVTDSDADRATLEDCVLLVPSFTDAVGVWYQADLTRTGEDWIVEAIRITTTGGCVPEEVADGAVAAYQAYYDAEAEFWDPPDPDSPILNSVLAEPQKSFVVGILERHAAEGIVLRGQPTIHPEVIEVRSPTELVILSCVEPDPSFGLYDMGTGSRLPDEPMTKEGQRDLESVVMVLEGGTWKVSDLQGQVDFACEFAPTDRGLPSV